MGWKWWESSIHWILAKRYSKHKWTRQEWMNRKEHNWINKPLYLNRWALQFWLKSVERTFTVTRTDNWKNIPRTIFGSIGSANVILCLYDPAGWRRQQTASPLFVFSSLFSKELRQIVTRQGEYGCRARDARERTAGRGDIQMRVR